MLELHAIVAVPDPIMLAGVMVPHARPDGTVSVIVTVPAKPLRAAIVIVVGALDPALVVIGVESLIVKSWNLKVMIVECDSVPLVAVIVRV